MAEPPPSDVLIWLDLEMTGLDLERDVIVEIAALATDSALRALDDGIDLVIHAPDEILEGMNDTVRKMHTASKLLDEIRASTLSLDEAGKQVLEYVRGHAPKPGTVPLCGNSIGVDRRFLARSLPELEEHLHYRSIDVSSIKELARRWHADAYQHRPSKHGGHRALADLQESIAELAYYREAIFR